ncbi:hypothetical protein O5904_24410, partial [Escherichia coli]|nr:hypothetical protein [Escherichia coli]
ATHRTAMLQLVDRIIVMDQGRIVMDGAKEAILREQSEPTARRVVLQEPDYEGPGNGFRCVEN